MAVRFWAWKRRAWSVWLTYMHRSVVFEFNQRVTWVTLQHPWVFHTQRITLIFLHLLLSSHFCIIPKASRVNPEMKHCMPYSRFNFNVAYISWLSSYAYLGADFSSWIEVKFWTAFKMINHILNPFWHHTKNAWNKASPLLILRFKLTNKTWFIASKLALDIWILAISTLLLIAIKRSKSCDEVLASLLSCDLYVLVIKMNTFCISKMFSYFVQEVDN